MRINDLLFHLIGARDKDHPRDEDFLAYSENRISPAARARFERHFSRCDDCQEVLAFLGREPEEAPAPLTEKEVAQQAGMILGYIAKDKRGHYKPKRKPWAIGGFSISYPKLASVASGTCAVVIGVFLLIGGSRASEANKVIGDGLKQQRNTEMRVSGGFDYSRYSGTRDEGADIRDNYQNTSDARFREVVDLLPEAARGEDAPADEKIVMARAYLALGTTQKDWQSALDILKQLWSQGNQTPELFNDMGVAYFNLGNYAEAIALFDKALQRSPRYNEALFNRAFARQAERYAGAQEDWKQYITQAPDDGWKAEAIERLGTLSIENEK